MTKCLVTKLKGSVSDSSLLRIGEFRIKVNKIDSPSQLTQVLSMTFNKECSLEIMGNGYFTDSSLSENKGKNLVIPANTRTTFYISNGDYEVSVLDKYSLTFFMDIANFTVPFNSGIFNKEISIDDLKYCTALTQLAFYNSKVTGDIANLKNLTALTSLDLTNSKVTGDIANLKNLTALTYISLYNTNTTGNISIFAGMSNIKSIRLANVYGNVSALYNLNLSNFFVNNDSSLTGDISKLPSRFSFLGLAVKDTSVFSWTSRDTTSTAFANSGTPSLSTSIDDMLINMGNCKNPITSSTSISQKVIQYKGTRTSASDAAVEKLQGYGFTVNIIA